MFLARLRWNEDLPKIIPAKFGFNRHNCFRGGNLYIFIYWTIRRIACGSTVFVWSKWNEEFLHWTFQTSEEIISFCILAIQKQELPVAAMSFCPINMKSWFFVRDLLNKIPVSDSPI